MGRLEAYADRLIAWNARIGLVGRDTVPDLWRRHILDCAQLYPLIDHPERPLLDFGSGAGLPGIVLAILGAADVHVVESNQRKAVFLREAARAAGVGVTVHAARIEALQGFAAGTVTARALAPVARLLDYACAFLAAETQCLFLKGARVEDELTEARKSWRMGVDRYPSISDPAGVILRIREIRRAE
ncbi:MAG: 16S rRNA (guanine(527)-N(7))-methyltransferase RsmG [Acetobacterales bacterium]